MKNIFILSIFLLLTVSISAQEAVKYPLLEHFTNTRCPICGARNPSFHTARADYGQDLLHISYHPSSPYPNCVLHLHNPVGNDSRFDYYRPPGTPTVYLDGNIQSGSNMLQPAEVEAALLETSYFQLNVRQSLENGILSAEVDITTRGELPPDNSYRLFVAAVEREVDYNAPNGESTHYNVFRVFLSNREGESITPPSNGSSLSWTGSELFHPDWDEEEIYILAFIEDTSNDKIENAGSSLQTTTSAVNSLETENISLFPNPSAHQIQVSGMQVSRWQLVSIMGRIRAEGGPLNDQPISLIDQPAGPYFLRLQDSEGEWQTFKVIKTE